jgi:hypothetical protein
MKSLHGPIDTSKEVQLFSTDALWVGLQVRRGVRADRAIQKELAPTMMAFAGVGAFSFCAVASRMVEPVPRNVTRKSPADINARISGPGRLPFGIISCGKPCTP